MILDFWHLECAVGEKPTRIEFLCIHVIVELLVPTLQSKHDDLCGGACTS